MDDIFGTWRQDKSTTQNAQALFDVFAEGIPEERLKDMKQRTHELVYTKEGDKIKVLFRAHNSTFAKEQTYLVELGKEQEEVNLDGVTVKGKMEWDGQKIKDTVTYPNGCTLVSFREINGNDMKWTMNDHRCPDVVYDVHSKRHNNDRNLETCLDLNNSDIILTNVLKEVKDPFHKFQ